MSGFFRRSASNTQLPASASSSSSSSSLGVPTAADDAKDTGGSGSKSPRRLASRILSRSSSRQSITKEDPSSSSSTPTSSSGSAIPPAIARLQELSLTPNEPEDAASSPSSNKMSWLSGGYGSSPSPSPSKLPASTSTSSASGSRLVSSTSTSTSSTSTAATTPTGSSSAAGGAGSSSLFGAAPPPPAGHVGNLTSAQEAKLVAFASKLSARGTLRAFPTSADGVSVAALSQAPTHSALGQGGKSTDTAQDPVSQQRIHLLRWLRARAWDVDAAVEMYEKAHEWKFRKPSSSSSSSSSTANADAQAPSPAATAAAAAAAAAPPTPAAVAATTEEPLDLEHKLQTGWTWAQEDAVAALGWKMYFHKVDKLGRPIFIQDLSGIDTAAIFKLVTPEQIVEKFAVTLESAIRYKYASCSVHAGRTIEDNFMILNVEGLGLSTFWAMKSQLQTLLGILDNNFPELSGRVQIINAPWVFATIFSYVRGWLPPATRDKVDIRGADYQPTLREFIHPDALPRSLGGTCDCHDAPLPPSPSSTRAGASAQAQEVEEEENDEAKAAAIAGAVAGAPTGGGPRGGRCGKTDVGPWPKSYAEYLEQRRKQEQQQKQGAATSEKENEEKGSASGAAEVAA